MLNHQLLSYLSKHRNQELNGIYHDRNVGKQKKRIKIVHEHTRIQLFSFSSYTFVLSIERLSKN